MGSDYSKREWGKNVLTLNPHIHQKSQKISNYYINDQTLLRIIKLLYKRTPSPTSDLCPANSA